MWLTSILDRNRVRFPDALALRDPRRDVTWEVMHRDVSALAAELARRADRDARVVIVSGNRTEYFESYFACVAAGLLAVPVNPSLTPVEFDYILSRVEPTLAIADPAGRALLTAAGHGDLPALPIEDVHLLPDAARPPERQSLNPHFAILFTSATTGRPKGVLVDDRSLRLNALSWFADVPVDHETTLLHACPLFHGSMVCALHYLAAGATVCVLDGFTPQGCLTGLTKWRPQHAFFVPSMVRLLLQARGLATTDLDDLRLVVHAAAPMPPDLAIEAAKVLDVDLETIYGITEGGGPCLALRPSDTPGNPPVPGATCVGQPMLGTAVRILRDDGEPADVGEIGEIHVAGDGVMLGYWRDDAATAEVLRDGWLNTRDLGCVAHDGYVWVVDRRNDLILRGGQNVYPAELEHVLRHSPQVADVAVVPAPSPIWGQVPVAFVQPTTPGGLDEAELVDLCRTRLASYKRPAHFVPVERVPRSPAGKILRQQLRQRAERLSDEGGPR